MKILLHSCCAPCVTYPLFLMRAEGCIVHGVFLNPNIHPVPELEKRWEAYRDFARAERFLARRVDLAHDEWLSSVFPDLSKPGRCRLCYRTRLFPVARMAKEEGYDAFTTTLLLSVYQDHEAVAKAGREAAEAYDLPFLYRDFRVGYKRSREIARGRHMYMQKYCGCEFSLGEGPGPGGPAPQISAPG